MTKIAKQEWMKDVEPKRVIQGKMKGEKGDAKERRYENITASSAFRALNAA